jgi:Na+-translocating ferredoxin:NAD+ oxidoreductase RnfC subunit
MDLIDAIRAAGVVGSGGAGFPTHVKLDVAASCLIINAAECEPLLETDKYLCRTFPDRIRWTSASRRARCHRAQGELPRRDRRAAGGH